MYAVIRTGGKQYRVAPGDVVEIELVASDKGVVSFTPLLVVDDKERAFVRSRARRHQCSALRAGICASGNESVNFVP